VETTDGAWFVCPHAAQAANKIITPAARRCRDEKRPAPFVCEGRSFIAESRLESGSATQCSLFLSFREASEPVTGRGRMLPTPPIGNMFFP
jgi:hypothetical protein